MTMRSLVTFITLLLIASSSVCAAPRTEENAAWNVNVNSDPSDPSRYYGKWENHKYFPSPPDWRSVAFYQLITDRFSNGDPTNDVGRYGGYDPFDVSKRQGGDFRGLAKKLDYIKGLGFNAVWISPVFQNVENEYHGYGQIDFTLLDDRFGTLEDLRYLVTEAHKRRMYIFVDIVVNHMSDLLHSEGYRDSQPPFAFHEGEYKLHYRNDNQTYADFKVDNTFHSDGSYCDVYNREGYKVEDSGTGSYWFSDFHHNGALTNYRDPWNIHLGKIYNKYDDLRTSHPRVQDMIAAMTKALIASTDIDGIRMDTPMQVPLCFFKRWAPAVREYAKSLGKKNFFIFGELYTTYSNAATMIGRGKTPDHYGKDQFIDSTYALDAGIDYAFYKYFAEPVLLLGKSQGLTGALELFERSKDVLDLVNSNVGERRYRMLNFFASHDQRRLGIFKDGSKKIELGAGLLAFMPGIPLFLAGDEQLFSSFGTGLEGHAREPMMKSIAWVDHPSVQQPNPATSDSFNMTHPTYVAIRRLMDIRRRYPVFQTGEKLGHYFVDTRAGSGVLGFSRSIQESEDKAFVIFNMMSNGWKQTSTHEGIKTGFSDGTVLVNLIDPQGARYVVGKEGRINELKLNPFELKALIDERKFKPASPTVISISPNHDAVVEAKATKITVTFSEPMDLSLLQKGILFNGELQTDVSVDSSAKRFHFVVTPEEGVNKLQIRGRVRSQAGVPLGVMVQSRLRCGHSKHPLVNEGIVFDSELVNGGQLVAYSNRVMLQHRSKGARYFRVSADGGKNWAEWERYRSASFWSIAGVHGWKELLVQYWIDGSAAYFSKGALDRYLYDGGAVDWRKDKIQLQLPDP